MEPAGAAGQQPDSTHLVHLADRVRRGDAGAEEEVVRLYERKVLALALVRTRNSEAAREITQDVLLGVVRALRAGQVRDPARLSAFVRGIARNLVSEFFRKLGRQPPSQPLTPEVALTDPRDDEETAARRAAVRGELDEMDAVDRTILTLTLVEGLKPGEIAPRVGLSPEAVRQRKSRAVRRLAERLGPLSRKAAS